MSEVQGLDQLSEQALRDRHADLLSRIAALREQEVRTLSDARELSRMTAEANQIVPLVVEFSSADADEIAALPVVPDPVAPGVFDTATTFVAGEETEAAEAIAASAQLRAAVSVRHEPLPEEVQNDRPEYSLVASAAANFGSIDAGDTMTLEELGAQVLEHAYLRGAGTSGANVPLVRFGPPSSLVASAVSEQNNATQNTHLLAQQILAEAELARWDGEGEEDEALTAAAFTICGPPDILRNVPECENTERYVQSWFRNVQSTHGQIQFYRSFSLADVVDGVQTWDQVAQTAVDDADDTTWKPCVEIGCLPTVTVGVEAVTQCMTMPLFQTMTSPEAVASALHAIRAATARVADGQLLNFFDILSSKYTHNAAGAGSPFGATIDLYDMLGRLLGFFTAANRQLDLSGYTLGIETGLIAHLMLDNQMACNPRAAQEAAETLFSGLGIGRVAVTPDWSLDDGAGPWSAGLPINPPASAAVAIPARPTSWKVRLFDAGDFGMLNPQGEAFGVVPDFRLKRQNKVAWFGEIYQGLGKLGCKPAASVEITGLAATGARSACVAFA